MPGRFSTMTRWPRLRDSHSRQHPRGAVGRSAGGEPDHQRDRPGRILCRRHGRDGHGTGAGKDRNGTDALSIRVPRIASLKSKKCAQAIAVGQDLAEKS